MRADPPTFEASLFGASVSRGCVTVVFARRVSHRLAAMVVVCAGAMLFGTAAAGWPSERTVGPFQIHATFDLDSVGPLIDELASLEGDVRSMLRLPPMTEPVHLFLFHDESSYQAYLRRHLPGVPSRKAVFIKADGPGMVFAYKSREFAIDVRHESTHAILHSHFAIVPLWLDEGLAEYFESPPADRYGNSPHLRPTIWNARFGLIPPISVLAGKRDLSEMGATEYRAAWAWMHFCLHHSDATREELIGFLVDRNAGRVTAELEPRLAARVGDLGAAMRAHFLK